MVPFCYYCLAQDNVLDLSKIENRMMVLRKEPISLLDICQDIHTLFSPTIPADVELIIDVPNHLWIYSDGYV